MFQILPQRLTQRSLSEVDASETLVASEGEPDLVQTSGGEPTIHPHLDILRLAKSGPIRHVMLTTNGIRIARDRTVARLAELRPGFEVYGSICFGARPENLRGVDPPRVTRRSPIWRRRNIHDTRPCHEEGYQPPEAADIVRHALHVAFAV